MKVLIIDDELPCREVLDNFLKEYCSEIAEVAEASSVDTGLEQIEKFKPDLVFLDIRLNDRTCFDLLNRLGEVNFQIIFTTAYDNYALKAFEYSALHYLLKPVLPSDFKDAIGRFQKQELVYQKEKIEKARGFYIKTVNNSYSLVYDEIAYIEADGSYSTIYSVSGEDIFTSKKLSDYKDLLNEDFFRIHNSIIVNMNFVRQIDERNNTVILSNGKELPVSRRKKTNFKQALESR